MSQLFAWVPAIDTLNLLTCLCRLRPAKSPLYGCAISTISSTNALESQSSTASPSTRPMIADVAMTHWTGPRPPAPPAPPPRPTPHSYLKLCYRPAWDRAYRLTELKWTKPTTTRRTKRGMNQLRKGRRGRKVMDMTLVSPPAMGIHIPGQMVNLSTR